MFDMMWSSPFTHAFMIWYDDCNYALCKSLLFLYIRWNIILDGCNFLVWTLDLTVCFDFPCKYLRVHFTYTRAWCWCYKIIMRYLSNIVSPFRSVRVYTSRIDWMEHVACLLVCLLTFHFIIRSYIFGLRKQTSAGNMWLRLRVWIRLGERRRMVL